MRPILIVNPIGDREFEALATLELSDGAKTVIELQSRLRARYPKTVVRARELSSEPETTWYVYRDGRWAAPEVGVGDHPGGWLR